MGASNFHDFVQRNASMDIIFYPKNNTSLTHSFKLATFLLSFLHHPIISFIFSLFFFFFFFNQWVQRICLKVFKDFLSILNLFQLAELGCILFNGNSMSCYNQYYQVEWCNPPICLPHYYVVHALTSSNLPCIDQYDFD